MKERPLDPDLPLLVNNRRWIETFKDLTSGAAGGIVQVLLGQPFDLVKVRLQTQGSGNPLRTTYDIWTKEGPLAFYKGSALPLIGIGACVSIQFGAFHSVRQVIEARNAQQHGRSQKSMSVVQSYLAGGIAGVANGFLSGPIEHIRIKLQTQPHGSKKIYNGMLDCVKKTYAQAGFPGIYRAQAVTQLREFHGFGIWFAVYEVLLDYSMRSSGQTRDQLPGWKIALCGGIAGDALWLATYPIDVVKTKLQSDGFGEKQFYKSARQVVLDIWRRERMRGFWAGLTPTLVRTMITSGGTFVTVEYVRQILA